MNNRFQIKQLAPTDGKDIYQMLQKLPENENGFHNTFITQSFEEFKMMLIQREKESRGIDLPDGYVAQTYYWFYVGDRPVGVSKIRHELNDALKLHGGNIGYAVVSEEREQGYATVILKLSLERLRSLGVSKALITCDNDNISSQKVIEKNGGVKDKKVTEMCRYWVNLN